MISCGLRNDSKGFQPLAADIQGVETSRVAGKYHHPWRLLPIYKGLKPLGETETT